LDYILSQSVWVYIQLLWRNWLKIYRIRWNNTK